VSGDGVELRPVKVDASDDEVCANVTLVSVKNQLKQLSFDCFSLVSSNLTKYASHYLYFV